MTLDEALNVRICLAKAIDRELEEDDPILFTVLECSIAALDRFIDRQPSAKDRASKRKQPQVA
jgi:hypothetical protein